MGLVEVFLVAVGLSMDAFAVSICKGLGMRRVNYRHAVVIALFFGGFQAGMPVLGYLLASNFTGLVEPFAHWIAFGLLAYIGGKMIWDAAHEGPEGEQVEEDTQRLDMPELAMLSVATSIDALAVGVSYAMLGVQIAWPAALIGITTFCFSFVGVVIGNRIGARWERRATLVGGIVLVCIGIKVVLEHYGLLP